VTVLGDIEQVRILLTDPVIARHARPGGKHPVTFDPVPSLALLERKPGAFDVPRPLEQWPLPDGFAVLRRRLENEGEGEGTRRFIKVLGLLESATLAQLTDAVEHAWSIGVDDDDAVRLILEPRGEQPVALLRLEDRPHLALVQVQPPNLSAYRCLRAGGGA